MTLEWVKCLKLGTNTSKHWRLINLDFPKTEIYSLKDIMKMAKDYKNTFAMLFSNK